MGDMKLKTGTGLTEHGINYEKKTIMVDFSGDYEGQCYRNDSITVRPLALWSRNASAHC